MEEEQRKKLQSYYTKQDNQVVQQENQQLQEADILRQRMSKYLTDMNAYNGQRGMTQGNMIDVHNSYQGNIAK